MSFLNCCKSDIVSREFIINNNNNEIPINNKNIKPQSSMKSKSAFENKKKLTSDSQVSNTENNINNNSTNNNTTNNNTINNNTSNNNLANNITNNMNSNLKTSQISFANLDISSTGNNISSSCKLLLTGNLFFNKNLIITQNGLNQGLRNRNDGQTFFGTSNAKDYTGTQYNDFIINLQTEENKQNEISHTGRIFGISCSKKTNEYQIYMMNGNYYLNYEITHIFYFYNEKEYLIILGKILLTIVQKDDINKMKIIEIKVESEDENGEQNFSFSEKNSPISIGRVNSSINLNYSFISKKHAIIEFSEENKKFFFKDLNSTNGSILILKEDDSLKIKGDMKFKLNDINFHILELP